MNNHGPSLTLASRPSAAARAPLPAILQKAEDAQYREMEHGFNATGGMASYEELTQLLRRHTDQPISQLARWIVEHEVLSFERHGWTLVPMFQFDVDSMTLRQPVRDVLRDLLPTLGGWETAFWFVRPNAWLGNATPLEAIARDPRAVHDAARAEGYLAR